MSLNTSSLFPPEAPAEQAKNLRLAVKERRIKMNQKGVKNSAPLPNSPSPKQIGEPCLAQRAQEASDFFNHETASDTASVNTLVANDENVIADCFESAIPLALEGESSLSYDNDRGLWKVTRGSQTMIGKSLKLEGGINLSYDSARELLTITYSDQTLIGEEAFQIKEYVDLNGDLRQASYIVKGQEPLVTYFPKKEISLAEQVSKQSGLYASLEEKLQHIRNYYCDLESEWWATSENSETEKEEIKNQLVEIFNVGYDLIEYIDKHPISASDKLDTTIPNKDIEKINQRINELTNKLKSITAGRPLSKIGERRLNILAGVIGVILLCAGLGLAAGIWSAVFSILKVVAQEYADHQSPQIKSRDLIKGAIDLLEQDINIQNERTRKERGNRLAPQCL